MIPREDLVTWQPFEVCHRFRMSADVRVAAGGTSFKGQEPGPRYGLWMRPIAAVGRYYEGRVVRHLAWDEQKWDELRWVEFDTLPRGVALDFYEALAWQGYSPACGAWPDLRPAFDEALPQRAASQLNIGRYASQATIAAAFELRARGTVRWHHGEPVRKVANAYEHLGVSPPRPW